MVSSSEKRALLKQYGEPLDARAAVAKAAAGLLVVLGIALIGLSVPEDAQPSAAVSPKQVASGR